MAGSVGRILLKSIACLLFCKIVLMTLVISDANGYHKGMRKITYATILALIILGSYSAIGHNLADPLFTIERSKNGNIVHYDARLVSDNELASDPVEAYWIMENGERQDLTWFERRYGYGITVGENSKDGGLEISLPNFARKMVLTKVDGKYKVVVTINGQRSILEKIYVKSSSGVLGVPKVEYAELYGRTLASGASTVERVAGKRSQAG